MVMTFSISGATRPRDGFMITPPAAYVAENYLFRHVPIYAGYCNEFAVLTCAAGRLKADMALLSELRYPTRWYSKSIAAILAVSFFMFVAAAIISGFLVYNIVTPRSGNQPIDLSSFPGHPEQISYSVENLGKREGWFFPGLKSAPTILLCPGYGEGREELLPLATALQEQGYNVTLVQFTGEGPKSTIETTLGYREVQELRAAMSSLAQRTDVDSSRFGLWGTDLGGYAALSLAESDPRVRAIAIESVYDRPQEMLRILVNRYGIGSLPLLPRFAEKGFEWLNYSDAGVPPLTQRLPRLAGVPKLFIEASDQPELSQVTSRLFVAAPEPKERATLLRGNYAGMLDDEKRSYENRIASFFLSNLPR
jgi:pimeloyl-ACP methyl ester carboxylesterase